MRKIIVMSPFGDKVDREVSKAEADRLRREGLATWTVPGRTMRLADAPKRELPLPKPVKQSR